MVDAGPRPGGQSINLRPGQYPGKPTMFQDNPNINKNTGAQAQAQAQAQGQPANFHPGQYSAPPPVPQGLANINANAGLQGRIQTGNQPAGHSHGQSSFHQSPQGGNTTHGAAFHNQFVTNNIMLIDPALLQHGADHNGGASTVNFSPTSHGFSNFSFPQNEGAGGNHGQPKGNDPGKPDAGDEMDIRAQYADILGENVFDYNKDYFTDKDFPVGNPAYALQSPSNTFDGTNDTHDHAMMQSQPATHTSDSGHLVYFQQNRTNRAAVMPAMHDESIYGNDGQSIAGAAAHHAGSAMSGPKDQAPRNNKRRLDADDDDSAEGMDGKAANGSQTQDSGPQAKRVRIIAPKPPVDAISRLNVKQSATPTQPTTQTKRSTKSETNKPSKAQTKKSTKAAPKKSSKKLPTRKQSLATFAGTDFKFAPATMIGMPREDAEEARKVRLELTLDGEDDDINAIKADSAKWIRELLDAFDKPYSQKPTEKKFGDDLIPEYQRWQQENYCTAAQTVANDESGKLLEATATVIFYMVVDAHKSGAIEQSSGKSFPNNTNLTCKQRLEGIIHVIEMCAIIRKDIVCGMRLDELVANPMFVLKRKEDNKFENEHKKPGAKPRARSGSVKKTESTDDVDTAAGGDGENRAGSAGEENEGAGVEKKNSSESDADASESDDRSASAPTRPAELLEDANEEPSEEADEKADEENDEDDDDAAEGSSG